MEPNDTSKTSKKSDKRNEPKIVVPKTCRVKKGLRYVDDDNIPDRVGGITSEFIRGFELLQKYDLAATFFGSARCALDSDSYEQATHLAHKLSDVGFTIITGGARGVMEAANKGAHEAGGNSIGINITLPMEQSGNKYTTDSEHFNHFFTRKVMLTFASEVYIYFPGGFGTLDEFFEIATLIQTEKIQPIPIVLIGKEFWTPLLEWLKTGLFEKHHTISKKDMEVYTLVDSVDEAYDVIMDKVCE